MLTTTLNVPRQTRQLRSTTLAYDAAELQALLAAPTDNPPPETRRSTRVLSPALLQQILARGAATQSEE